MKKGGMGVREGRKERGGERAIGALERGFKVYM